MANAQILSIKRKNADIVCTIILVTLFCKENNEYVIKYYSDDRIIARDYKIV